MGEPIVLSSGILTYILFMIVIMIVFFLCLIATGHKINKLTWFHGHFDNIVTKFTINKKTDAFNNWRQFVFYNNTNPKRPKTRNKLTKDKRELWFEFCNLRWGFLFILFVLFWVSIISNYTKQKQWKTFVCKKNLYFS